MRYSGPVIQEFDKKSLKPKIPELRGVYTVRVQQKIKEGDKERLQAFEGIVVKINAGYGPGKTITVRKVVDGIGVEKIFPVHSPNIASIDIVKKLRVRRAKLYYLRGKLGKHYKLYEAKEKKPKVVEKVSK